MSIRRRRYAARLALRSANRDHYARLAAFASHLYYSDSMICATCGTAASEVYEHKTPEQCYDIATRKMLARRRAMQEQRCSG